MAISQCCRVTGCAECPGGQTREAEVTPEKGDQNSSTEHKVNPFATFGRTGLRRRNVSPATGTRGSRAVQRQRRPRER